MDSVLFGAELDTSGLKKGAAEVVNELEKLKAAQAELVAQTEALNAANKEIEVANVSLVKSSQSLTDNNKKLSAQNKELTKDAKFQEQQIKALNVEYAKLDRSSRQGREAAKALALQEKQLKAELQQTVAQINNNSFAIDKNTLAIKAHKAEMDKNSASLKTNTAAAKENGATIAANAKTIAASEKAIEGVGKGSSAAVQGVSKLYGGLRVLANIIPGLGISGLILLISEFGEKAVMAFFEAGAEADKFRAKQKLLKEVFADAAKAAGSQVAQLEVFRLKLNDLSLTEAERVKVAKEYNKVADEQNQLDLKQINNLQLINEKIAAQNKLIIARAVSVAALGKLGEKATTLVETELNLSQALRNQPLSLEEIQKIASAQAQATKNLQDGTLKTLDNYSRNLPKVNQTTENLVGILTKEQRAIIGLVNAKANAQRELDELAKTLSPLITPEGLTTKDKGSKGAGNKGPENVFAEKLAELRARLANAQLAEFQSEPLILAKFEQQLNKEFAGIEKLLRDKKLTGPQADILKAFLKQINEIELSKSLDEFREKQKAALGKINEALLQASVEGANKRVANIRDEFERDKEAIELAYTGTIEALNKKLIDLRDNIDKEAKKGLISPEIARQKKSALGLIFGDLFNQAEIDKSNKQLELAFRVFQNTIKEGQRALDDILVQNDERSAAFISQFTKQFLAGEITYKQYQDKLTELAKEGARIRNRERRKELEEELKLINGRLATTTDANQKKSLQDQQLKVRGEIARLNSEIDQAAAKDQEEDTKKRIDKVIEYANALNNLLGSVASFWGQVNAVEQASLERSIALQQKRVDNAREIADKGNAEYLEMEQKRMDELERKREENARKQIAINNALVLSQATVAAISAIAQAASSGNPLLAIAALASVIGAIGAAFSFANSLQPQSTSFYEGTESVSGDGRPRGKDTIPARLNIGERVVTTQKNQEYWDTLHAIHNGAIPSNVLNGFVKSYPNHSFPTVDFNKLAEATNNKMGSDSTEVARKLDETNNKLEQVVEAVAGIKVGVNFDPDGLAVTLQSFVKRGQLKKKA